MKALPTHTSLNSFIIQPESYGATVDEGFIVGGPVGDFELLLCHGTVCVVGKMRDLILQLSKSSIYSTKPRMASEPSETNAIPAMEALTAVIIGKYRYLIQAKRYRGHIALQHVQEFEKLLKRHNCRGLFCHTGKTGAGSKSVSIASERMEIISGQRLIDLLTPGSSFTIATAPQTMMKRTAATLETSTIVKDAGKENRYHES